MKGCLTPDTITNVVPRQTKQINPSSLSVSIPIFLSAADNKLLDNPLVCFCIHPRATATGATCSIGGYPGMCKKTTIPLAAFATTLCVPQTIVSGIQIFCIFYIIVIESSVVGASIICGTFASLSFPF